MKKVRLLAMVLGVILVTGVVLASDDCCSMKKVTTPVVATAKENAVFTYAFSEKPKIGTTVFMVTLKEPKTFKGKIEAQYGMPSMSGAHDSGWVALLKNKKGVYVTPVSFVMPGDWQIDVRITEGKTVHEYKVVTTI